MGASFACIHRMGIPPFQRVSASLEGFKVHHGGTEKTKDF